MIRKIVVAIISSIILCLSFAIVKYTPAIDREPDVYYFSFFSLVMIYLIYATPVYLLGGVPSSFLIDRIKRKVQISNSLFTYFFEATAYLLFGFLTIFLFLLVLSGGKILFELADTKGFFRLGGIASLLYYHIYLVSYLVKKRKGN